MSLREVMGGRVRQVLAECKVHGLELRALREVLGGRVRQVPAKSKVHFLALREVLGGRVCQLSAACKIHGLQSLNGAFRDRSIAVGERAPDRECFVLLK